MSSWRRDLSDSAADFVNVVWPVVKGWCNGGEIIPVEGVTTDALRQALDRLAGIDAWQVVDKVGMRGIASRVQYVHPYASFTIRKRRSSGATTEHEKRTRASAGAAAGWLYPALTVQAYLSERGGRLLYACMVGTSDLFNLASSGAEGRAFESRTNREDGNVFDVFWVEWLRQAGVRVREFVADGVAPAGPRSGPLTTVPEAAMTRSTEPNFVDWLTNR